MTGVTAPYPMQPNPAFVFVVPARHPTKSEGAGLVVVAPPFRVFCGRMQSPDTEVIHHGLWLTQRPDVQTRDVVDPDVDWLLVDFGTPAVAPQWKRAQAHIELWLLQQVGIQLASGYRSIDVTEILRQVQNATTS